MRVLVIAPGPFPASRGSQLLVERTTAGLIARGHGVDVVVPRFGEAGRAEPFPLRRAGLPRLGRGIDSRPDLRRAVDDVLLLREALRCRPDVLVGHNVEGALVAGLAGAVLRAPAVYFRHTAFGEEIGCVTGSPAAGRAGAVVESLAARLCQSVIQLAPHPTDGLPGRAEEIPPPADPLERRVEPADGRTLYYEGNLDPYQNPSWLWAALSRARQADPRVRLLLGRGPEDRPPAADLALVPRTIAGGFPMKLLAYQVAGIAAVCVESGAPGLVHGLDAFVVPGRGSASAFAEAVAAALADSRSRETLRERARERALSRNDPAEVARRLESSLAQTCMARGPARSIFAKLSGTGPRIGGAGAFVRAEEDAACD